MDASAHITGVEQKAYGSLPDTVTEREIPEHEHADPCQLSTLLAFRAVGAQVLLDTLLVNALWHAVKSGAADPERPTFLYLDEFQDFLNLPVSPGDMLAQARSFGLAMTLAPQHLAQLRAEVLQAVLSNARSKVIFQTAARDARMLAAEFGKRVSEDDFVHLGSFEVICRIASGGGVSEPMTGETLPPAPKHQLERLVRAYSRSTFGRPVKAVDEEIKARRSLVWGPTASDSAGLRPKLGAQPWEA